MVHSTVKGLITVRAFPIRATGTSGDTTFLLTIKIKSANLEHVGWIGDRARQASGQHGASDVLHVRVFAA